MAPHNPIAMASQQPPPKPPPVKSEAPPAPTTIRALTDDLLREIFLRLPSLPNLVRAALSCRAFLAAVRASPAFRRRFRALHPSPLIGFFFDPDGPDIPSFAPLRRRSDPDLAAVVRGADFFLTRVPDCEDACPGWQIRECYGGYVLLVSWITEQIAAYNPLTRALDLLPAPPGEIADGCDGEFVYHGFHIVSSDEAPGSFHVVSLCYDASRVRAAVFSSGTRDWRVLPWEEPASAQPAEDQYWLLMGTQVNGSLYCSHADQAYKLVLDTATLQFSCIDLPEELKGQGHIYTTGETKDGRPCIVSTIQFLLCVYYRRAADDGVEKWVLDSRIPLEGEVLRATEGSLDDHGRLKVWHIVDGVVYMSTFESLRDPSEPCWFLSFCLETRKLEKIFHRIYDSHVRPYIMAWPPSLVGNNGSP